jgi:hypothetical protein
VIFAVYGSPDFSTGAPFGAGGALT